MTTQDFFDEEEGGRGASLLRIAIPVTVLLLVAGGIWYLMHSSVGVRREAPRIQTILATLPPPPPPPPKVEQPEPEKKLEDVPKPNDQPKPVDAPRPITINGPAQAGNDAFNITAGDGGGSVVSNGGFGDATYSRYMGSSIQQAVQQDERVNRFVFTADIAVWIDANGHLIQARILKSTGDSKIDSALIVVLQDMPALDQPPGSLQFPQRVAIRGRRSA